MRTMAAASVREHVRALNAMKVSMFATMFAQSSRVHIARLMPGWITPASMRKLRGGGGRVLVRRAGCASGRQAEQTVAHAGAGAEAGGEGEGRGKAPDESDRHVGEPGEDLLRWVVARVGEDAGREKHVHRRVGPRVVPQFRAAVLRGERAGVAHLHPTHALPRYRDCT